MKTQLQICRSGSSVQSDINKRAAVHGQTLCFAALALDRHGGSTHLWTADQELRTQAAVAQGFRVTLRVVLLVQSCIVSFCATMQDCTVLLHPCPVYVLETEMLWQGSHAKACVKILAVLIEEFQSRIPRSEWRGGHERQVNWVMLSSSTTHLHLCAHHRQTPCSFSTFTPKLKWQYNFIPLVVLVS